ncbi:hypothetical protein KAF25_006136, partial [Fusarium avenaceum]
PYNDYVNDLTSSDPRLRRPDYEQHLPGIPWDSRIVNSRILTFREGEKPDVSISTAVKTGCLRAYLSQRDLNGKPLRRAYIFEGMNKDVATVLGNHFWMDPSFFIEYHRTANTVSKKARCNEILATSLATQPYISLPYRDLVALPRELVGYFGLSCSATRRMIEITRFNGEFDSVAYARRLDLATVEANWSSCQTLEKRLHQYCYDLEHTLAQMRVPLQRPDLAQVTSWRDVHVDFQMLHHRFENARNWVGKINASITGLTGIATGIAGNRQAFREQQLSLEAAHV